MDFATLFATGISAYLIGSVSFARLISRLIAPEVDITNVTMDVAHSDQKMKMQAIGANTVSMKLGARVGCTIGLLDILKGFLPTLALRLFYPEQPYFLAAAVCAMVGHNWPIFHRFKGGRGISTYYGGFFAIDWIGALITSSVGMMLGMAVLKDMLVAYLAGLWLVIPWMWFTQGDRAYLLYAVSVNVIFMLAMLPEIREVRHNRQRYGKEDMQFAMRQFPMGRSMLRIMERLKFKKS
jgi:acyl phosphate:glycerol-3-phosphate acyltransferase